MKICCKELDVSEIKDYLRADLVALHTGMRKYLGSDIALLNSTNEGLLLHSGKHMRPILSLLMAKACSADGIVNENSIKYAVAAELLHNATLLHDDVADSSDLRRGEPTLYKQMGPSISVLVGDFWLVRAMQAILDVSPRDDEAITLFSRTLSNLAEGEMLQLQKAEKCDTSFEDYLAIIFRKTASLFQLSAMAGVMSMDAPAEYLAAAQDFGLYLGYAFQMKDDIFDYMDSDVGKPVGVDILEKKITLPLLGAFENAPRELEMKIRDAVRTDPALCRDKVLEFVRSHEGISQAQKVLNDYVRKAVDALKVLPDGKARRYLGELAEYTALRDI